MESGKSITYAGFYKESKEFLRGKLLGLGKESNDKSKRILISLGRKGIKIFELLFFSNDECKDNKQEETQEEIRIPIVVSEHALPFISMNDQDSEVDYNLMDDALYYGSSAKGVAEEIYAFENIYKIKRKKDKIIHFYSAIQTDELRPHFEQYIEEVFAKSTKDEGIGIGYSHYFAKHLAKDIRTLEDTFEKDYPIVTFNLDRSIGLDDWKEAFEEVFRDTGTKVYVVEHAENYSINVLFEKTNECSFRKFRIFPSNSKQKGRIDRVKVVCMAPRPVWNEDYLLEHIFDDANEEYKNLWLYIFEKCNIKSSKINPDNIIDYLTIAKKRCNKSLVVMLNYLLSFSTFVEQKDRLNEVLSKAGLKAEFKGVDKNKDLFYLLGDNNLCKTVAENLENFYKNGTISGEVYTSKDIRFDYTVFENSESIDDMTSSLIRIQNKIMVENSKNVEEALGALFFNQDSFYEKQILESNPITQDFSRLRMGYTFDGLFQVINHFVSQGLFKDEDATLTIHRWVDQRIGEASIVPQYILDEKSEHWVRVFRHGENEETLLSHLARYVLMIFREWNKIIPLGWIEKKQFQELLADSYKYIENDIDKGKEIVESKNISFKIEENVFVFKNNRYNENGDNPRNVLQYLIDMCIFTEEDGKISINKRTNFIMPPAITTLESETENKIKEMVSGKAKEFVRNKAKERKLSMQMMA